MAQGLNPGFNLQGEIQNCQKLIKTGKHNDFYKILGVDKKANDVDIKKAYKKLAMKFHPDRNNDSQEQKDEAEKKFKQIQKAYDVLSDPKKRQQYDLGGLDDNGNADQSSQFNQGFHFNAEDLFGGFGQHGHSRSQNYGGPNMEHIFRMFETPGFGGFGQQK